MCEKPHGPSSCPITIACSLGSVHPLLSTLNPDGGVTCASCQLPLSSWSISQTRGPRSARICPPPGSGTPLCLPPLLQA